MNEIQARREGLCFTGAYARAYEGREKLKEKAKELRKQGYRARLVTESRGGCSVYVEQKYYDMQVVEHLRNKIKDVDKMKEAAKEKYETELREIDDAKKKDEQALSELLQKLADSVNV